MGRSQFSILFSLILVTLLHSVASEEDTTIYRLLNETKPVFYNVELTTRIDNDDVSFTGRVEIEIVPQIDNAKTIQLNQRELTITTVVLTDQNDGKDIPVSHEIKKEVVIITPKDKGTTLQPGHKYTLTLTYNGNLRSNNAGFYASSYTDKAGNKKMLATTQFETTDARHAFPCYDEPAFKARFDIKITHGKSYHASSNMPVLSRTENPDGETVTTVFETTPHMSTYLIAFVVSDFEYLQTQINGRNEYVYAKSEAVDSGALALSIGKKVLKHFEDYLQVGYNLPKMDQFAIPDFAAGAMENWGLVTYREEMLLYTEGVSTTATKTKISNTIAHEFAHQWFGDLVSPEWWTYTWLNEGFATLFAYIGTSEVYPTWKIDDYFMVQEYQTALSFDASTQTRPMTHYVQTPEEIAGVFDTISYSKAGSVLRMIRKAIGEDSFKKGLTKYLNSRKQESANPDDLFTALDSEVNEATHLKEVFVQFAKSWTEQAGIPIVHATKVEEGKKVNLTQEPYRVVSETTQTDNRLWYIPINFVKSSDELKDLTDTTPKLVLSGKTKIEVIEGLADEAWFLLNRENTGYYRVNYDDTNWEALAKQLQSDRLKIHRYQRAQLIDDVFALALVKRVTFKMALNVTRYIEKEYDYVPWAAATNVFEKLNNMLDGTSDYENFTYFIHDMTSKKFGDLSFYPKREDSHLDIFTRKLVVDWACRSGVNNCLENANEELKKSLFDGHIHPDAREIIYCNGLRNGEEKEFNNVLGLLKSERDAAVRRELMSVLGCVLKDELLEQYMDTALDKTNNYRLQERLNVLPAVYSRSNNGITAAIKWLVKHWNDYSEIVPDFTKTNPVVVAVRGIAARIYNEKQQEEFEVLAKLLTDEKFVDAVAKAKATIVENVNWANEHRDSVANWFKDYRTWNVPRDSAAFILPSVTLIFTLIISVFVSQT